MEFKPQPGFLAAHGGTRLKPEPHAFFMLVLASFTPRPKYPTVFARQEKVGKENLPVNGLPHEETKQTKQARKTRVLCLASWFDRSGKL
jgi:hypothetical protein